MDMQATKRTYSEEERKASIERSRARRRRIAEDAGREVRAWVRRGHDDLPYYQKPGAKESRAAYKRQKRAEQAMQDGRKPDRRSAYALHDAHVVAWSKKKPELHNAHVRLYHTPSVRAKVRTATDPAYRLNQRMRVQIRKALKGGKHGRSWETFLGYTLGDLVAHLSRMLPAGKTLQACLAEGWHIDHILPKSGFDCSQPEELRSAWALPNLRLTTPEENLRKSYKREHLL